MGLVNTAAQLTETALLEQVDLPGRKSELRQLLKALTLCRSGQGKAIFICGNEGIGKTAVLNALLQIARDACGCEGVVVPWVQPITPQLFFAQTVQEILTFANRLLQDRLKVLNEILKPIGLQWHSGDLLRVVALVRLQESMANRQQVAVDQVGQAIYGALPFFQRRQATVKQQVQQLAEIVCDPWMTLAVSLVNPINPHVQKAVFLVEQILGQSRHTKGLETVLSHRLPLLAGSSIAPSGMLIPQAAELGGQVPQHIDLVPAEAENEVEAQENGMPSLSELQTTLIDLLNFINSGLRQHQSTFILAFDQWEILMAQSEDIIKDIKDLLSETLRQTVEQRDTRLMVIISGQSERESYTVGGSLFNALRIKTLVAPLAGSVQQRYLRDQLKALGIQVEDPVLQEVLKAYRGNPGWLTLWLKMIALDAAQTQLTMLDGETYQERYALREPQELLDLLYTRLQLLFVGEEAIFLKALQKLVSQFAYQTFTRRDAFKVLPAPDPASHCIEALLDGLANHGFLSEIALPQGETVYRFYSPFALNYLKEKCRPLQEDIPTMDKVASLQKILPLSIQSGELTVEKTQELLAMARALESEDLSQFVEQTLIDALAQAEVAPKTKQAALESLALLATERTIRAIMGMLADPDPLLREAACLQLVPFLARKGYAVPQAAILNAMLPLTQDSSPTVRQLAYECLARFYEVDRERLLPLLYEGTQSDDPNIRLLALTGLVQHRTRTPEAVQIYRGILETATDAAVFKMALKGLQACDTPETLAFFMQYLEQHPQTPQWQEVLLVLMGLDFAKAYPWVAQALAEGVDETLRQYILKRLGSKPSVDAERLLIQVLQPQGHPPLAPELRWLAIRSLGQIGHTRESLVVLESQQPFCQQDEILDATLKNAIRLVGERISTTLSLLEAPGHGYATRALPNDAGLGEESRNGAMFDPEATEDAELVSAAVAER